MNQQIINECLEIAKNLYQLVMSDRLKKFFTIMTLLLVSAIIELIVGYYNSSDIRGWWTLVLIVTVVTYWIYGSLFIIIDNINPTSQKYVIIYNSILSTIIAIESILYYTIDIDWLAINNGTKTLTLFESIIHNTSTDLILGIFLLIHLTYVFIKRQTIKQKTTST
jgi:hypothetical protein